MIDFQDKKVVFGVLVAGILIFVLIRKLLGFLSNDRNMKTYDPSSGKQTAESVDLASKVMEHDPLALTARAQKARDNNVSFTAAAVAKHNTPEDCWIIFKGDVYDVTTFVSLHPGGEAITRHAGKDNTRPILDQGAHPHQRLIRDLASYYIGTLSDNKKSR